MQYLLDTVTIIRHFSGRGRIGRVATQILDTIEEHDDVLVISVISLMEIMYLAERNRITINLTETLARIESSTKYVIINLNPEILRVAETIAFYELHDRLILATAKWLDIPIMSSDKAFENVPGIKVIWD
jgi:predicted nucleic acid-binding protein